MTFLEAIIYGIIQGIAEFLPISSSGHLALAQNFSDKFLSSDALSTKAMENNFTFNILLHLATLISVCVVFRKDVLMLIKGCFSFLKKLFTGKIKQGLDSGERLFLMLVIATAPLIPMKLLGADDAVEVLTANSLVIGILLIFNGSMLILSDKIKKGSETIDKGGYIRPLGVGLVQATIGLLPGVSRSGSTITGGRIFGFSREEAVRFSFLMSIPAILGACVTELPDMFNQGLDMGSLMPMLIGAVTAAVVGFFAIKLLQYLTKNKSFTFFAVYCIIIGAAAIIIETAF